MPLSKVWAGSLVLLEAVSLPLHAASPLKSVQKSIPKARCSAISFCRYWKATAYRRSIKCNSERLLWCAGRLLPVNWISIRNIPAMARFSLKMKTMRHGKRAARLRESQKLDAEQNKLIWLTPAPANNTWTIAVRQDVAEKNKLTSLADLSRYLKEGGTFKLAASAEFIERADALPAFEKAYDFKLDQDQLLSLAGGDTAVTIKAAAQQTSGVNAAMAYGTDGPVAALGLQTLSDPQGVQPIYAPAPVVREPVLKEYPQMAQWLQPVFASLDAKTLQQLNASIAVEGLDAKKVAADYLKQKGWTK